MIGRAVVARAALALVAATLAFAAAAGCNDSCANNCSGPVFDLAMGRVSDLAVARDLAITSAGVVTVGAGAANSFTPSTVTIQAGQSVTWNWVSGFHSVVSDSMPKAFADSPSQSAGQFTVMFATAGMYPYHCGIHGTMMSGTIVVQ
jgi:plastocyanin